MNDHMLGSNPSVIVFDFKLALKINFICKTLNDLIVISHHSLTDVHGPMAVAGSLEFYPITPLE